MFRRTVSLLMLLACVGVLPAQVQPKPTPPKPESVPKEPTLDEKIALALRNHPDIKIAEAKRALAEAELEQAKLALSLKIAVASAKVYATREELLVAKEMLKRTESIDASSFLEIMQMKKSATIATSNFTLAETELKNLLVMPKAEKKSELRFHDKQLNEPTVTYPEPLAPSGPNTQLMLEFLNTKVKFDLRRPSIVAAFRFIENEAKSKVVLRFPVLDTITELKKIPETADMLGEMSMHAWLLMYMDELNSAKFDVAGLNKYYEVYVREYGFLICQTFYAPDDAMTLKEFWKRGNSGKMK